MLVWGRGSYDGRLVNYREGVASFDWSLSAYFQDLLVANTFHFYQEVVTFGILWY